MRTLEIHVLDVGTADAILIIYRDAAYRHATLIDSATAEHIDALVNACWLYAGGVIDLLVVSHPDGDHVGGVRELVKGVMVREVMSHDPQLVFDTFGGRLEKADPRIQERIDCLRTGAEVVRHLRIARPVRTPLPGFRPAPHLVVCPSHF